MELREWTNLPDKMRTKEVRKYYNILVKRSAWFRAKRILDVIVASIMFAVLCTADAYCRGIDKAGFSGTCIFQAGACNPVRKDFRIYKFRTMVNNASRMGTQVTVSNDARITRVGRWLRKLRIDEFPQLFNILAGDMTLVGTRPEVLKYVDAYTPEMYATLLLPAGLTSRTSIAYKDEERLLSNAEDADKVYIEEVLPAKMRYNLESLKKIRTEIGYECTMEHLCIGDSLRKSKYRILQPKLFRMRKVMFITICVIAYNEEQTLPAILKGYCGAGLCTRQHGSGAGRFCIDRPHEENHAGIRSTEYNTARYGICKRKRA